MNPKLGRKAMLIAAGIGGAVLLGWLVMSQGPLAPAKVTVNARQLVAELDAVDLTDRVTSGDLAAERAVSTIRAADAQLAEAQSRAQVAVSGARG